MTEKPTVTISHSIPGRLRVHLSDAPRDADDFRESVKGHAGLESVEFTRATRSVLVCFDPRLVTREEVVIRIALALSLDLVGAPVIVLKSPESEVLTNGAAFAGILTGTSLLLQGLAGSTKTALSFERLAALGTGTAVLQHGWREIRERGYFDPEVLSLTYLVSAALRGSYARGALITWMLAFGRRLLTTAPDGGEIRPVRHGPDAGDTAHYEFLVVPGVSRQAPLFAVLQSFARYLAAAGGSGETGLLGELRAVSSAHGEMMEGLGCMRHDIPMRFE